MALLEQLDTDIKAAMKAKDDVKLRAVRGLKNVVLLKSTEKGSTGMTPEKEILAIQSAIKTRKESLEIYTAQNREDLMKIEADEIAVIESYLPKQLSTDEVTDILKKIIADTGATSPKDMGKVMKVATPEIAGRADGKTVSELVKSLLTPAE